MFNPNRFAAENDTRIEELISHKVGSFFFPDKYILGNLFIPHPSPQVSTREPITFGTTYETGRYVIFAVGNISTEAGVKNGVDFLALMSSNVRQRQTAINSLLKASLFTNTVDVQPEDQLLLLVTCVDKDDERRVVAARRVRDGEDENQLKTLAERSRKK